MGGKVILSYNSYGEGHINNTYLVTVNGKTVTRYILQRINTLDIFTDPKSLMGNICGVTYLRDLDQQTRGDVSRGDNVLIVPTKPAVLIILIPLVVYGVYNFAENITSLQQCRNNEDFYTSARIWSVPEKSCRLRCLQPA